MRPEDERIYTYLQNAMASQFDPVKTLKESARGRTALLRHRCGGQLFVCRQFSGGGEVYRRLLPLRCAHLPRVYEVAEEAGRTLVLEEYIYGDDLSFLLQGGLFSVGTATELTVQLCQGLYVLHQAGAVHRDVKPENVILRGREAVLIDFDASRLHKPEQTADTVVLGTTGYAAPEQYGLGQSDSRADIYSLGVLLNVMLTGHHPSQQLARGHLGRVVRRCAMMSPDQRYADVLRLMADL